MAGKDIRTRNGNVGRRGGTRKGPQGSQQAFWDAAQGSAVGEAVVPGLVHTTADASKHMWDGPENGKKPIGAQLFLSRLPTPSRAPERAFGEQSSMQQDHHHQYQHGHHSHQQFDRMGSICSEPWSLQQGQGEDQTQRSPSQPQPSYREWLQARGQQAMQRTMTAGGSTMSPTASVASPTASPHSGQILSSMPPLQPALPALPPLPLSAPAGPDPMVRWAHVPQQPPLQQPQLPQPQMQQPQMHPPPLQQPQMQPQMQHQQLQQSHLQQPWCPCTGGLDLPLAPRGHVGAYHQPMPPTLPPAALARVPPLEEACGQQSPMMSMTPGCMVPPMTTMNGGDVMCGQLTPSTAAPSPLMPSMPQLPISPGAGDRWSQEELLRIQHQEFVAQLMPGLLSMDKEQLAQQLREAAPCVYDD